MRIYESLKKNKEMMMEKFHNNSDISVRDFKLSDGNETDAFFIYMQGVCDLDAQRQMMYNIFTTKIPEHKPTIRYLAENVITTLGCEKSSDSDEITRKILQGETVLFVDGEPVVLIIATAMWMTRSISEPPTSTVVSGPREGFTEDLKVNLTQIRRRLQTPDLIFERFTIGRYSNTDVAVIYIDGLADKTIVKKITKRIQEIDIDGILDIFYIQQFLEESKNSIFKQAGTAEKPDIVAGKVLEGRIAIMVNGSPMAITLPYLLYEDFQQSEDYYTRNSKSIFLRILRLCALLIGILLPGFYVSVQVYHYTIVPKEYLFTLMNAIQGLPTKPMMEILLVLLMFEIIHEASFRMPKYVGMAMSIVGALVLGDTAVKANLISTPAIMIMALSSIALYTIPDQVGAFRLLRIGFTIASGIAGLFGMIVGLIGLVLYWASLDSYGTPFLAPFAPYVNSDLKDGPFQKNITEITTRPHSFPNVNETRLKVKDKDAEKN